MMMGEWRKSRRLIQNLENAGSREEYKRMVGEIFGEEVVVGMCELEKIEEWGKRIGAIEEECDEERSTENP